jgi:hypothetical protein
MRSPAHHTLHTSPSCKHMIPFFNAADMEKSFPFRAKRSWVCSVWSFEVVVLVPELVPKLVKLAMSFKSVTESLIFVSSRCPFKGNNGPRDHKYSSLLFRNFSFISRYRSTIPVTIRCGPSFANELSILLIWLSPKVRVRS